MARARDFTVELFEARLMLSHHKTPAFQPVVSINVGHSVSYTAVGDFNHDGRMDILCAGDDGLFIVLGAGKGRFYPAQQVASGIAAVPIVADFNGDGKPDVAFDTGTGIDVALGTGRGTFYTPVTVLTGNDGIEGAADFNGDGKADLILEQSPFEMLVERSNGNGTFTQSASFTYTGPINFGLAADINGDGKLDLLNNDVANNRLDLELGNGNGTFSSGGMLALPTNTSMTFYSSDFNRDGKPDLLFLAGSKNYVDLGSGNGTFPTGKMFHLVTTGDAAGLGYLNNGRTIDLALLSEQTGKITVLSGDGTGNMAPYVTLDAGTGASNTQVDDLDGLSVGDLNGDGISDIICTRPDLKTINIYFAG